jgi:copper(I)-binding protein
MRSRASCVFIATLLVAACSHAQVGGVTVSNAWVRATTSADATSAAYLTITNQLAGDERLIGVSSPAAAAVEIHRTTTDSMGMTDMPAVSEMHIPAGATVTLEPGGFHLMLTGLKAPLKAGGPTIPLTLTFALAEPITVQADVRATSP